jgi:hypothetical protein
MLSRDAVAAEHRMPAGALGSIHSRGNIGVNSSCRPTGKPALSAATGSKNDPKPGKKNANSGRPLFPKSHLPVFSLLFAFGKII